MKKILFLNYCYPGQGTYHRCHYFARCLVEQGYKVDLICSSATPWDMGIRIRYEGEHLRVITLPSPFSPGSAIGYLLRTVIGVLWVLFKRYDLIHAFGVALPSTAIPAIVARWFKRKTTIVVDWDDAWGDAYRQMFGRVSHFFLALLENKTPLWAKPDAFTVVSRFFQIRLLKMGIPIGLINIVPNGADTDLIKPIPKAAARKTVGWKNGEVILLSMGHNYFGSLDVLMETFAHVLERKPEARLKMLGNILRVGKYGRRMDVIMEKFAHLSPKIEMIGEVPREKVNAYLCAADCLVMPMENSVIDHARAPIRLGDYLACGRPVAANAVGYSRDLLEEVQPNAICKDPDNRREFADKIVYLLDHPTFGEEIGRAGLELARGKQNWRAVCDHLGSIYRGLL